ncbi:MULTISPECIES: hypothetical protein [Clostridium]|uniref:Uncharacterized protein n=1 Tax=Clostridium manihotivorum TaxID=2320868 RepID=A0A3R5VBQ8_9CLOT|nr:MULTISPECIES: hypothetical protein [Clostridium]QAA34759.1 hypothetical protein C1I91_25715 [Clostridium manihotivorum]
MKEFCIENELTRSQFYYHRRRLEKINSSTTIFHEVSLSTDKDNIEAYSNEENYYDIRFKSRSEKLAPVLDNFIEYVEREIKDALPRSHLGKSLDYAEKHLLGLKNVLLDGFRG